MSNLYQKAFSKGYKLTKGNQHYIYNNSLVRDKHGRKIPGYMLMDMTTGCYVFGSFNDYFDYLWSIDDVTRFLADLG